MVLPYIRDGSLLRENSAGKAGALGRHSKTHICVDPARESRVLLWLTDGRRIGKELESVHDGRLEKATCRNGTRWNAH